MPAASTALLCLVIGITDGDTLTARCDTAERAQNVKVRLAEIDAPEARQPWGRRSRQSLADLCFGKHAQVHAVDTDRNGRLIAHVSCDGIDSGAEQVRSGMAWVYERYAVNRTLFERQQAARQARLGLWQDPAPTPPWIWRREHKPLP